MNFKAYDILSSLVPGFITFLAILSYWGKPFDKDLVIAYTAISFLVGYLLNALGSWLENFYFFTWGGRPSSRLLIGKGLARIRLFNYAELEAHLKTKTIRVSPSTNELFSIALRYSSGDKDNRIEDFGASYAFSRTLLTSGIVCSYFFIYPHATEWKYYLISILVIAALWYRCKQRAYYFSLEVLNAYSRKNNL